MPILDANLSRENTVCHRDGGFFHDYHAREFTAKNLKADICPVLQSQPELFFWRGQAYLCASRREERQFGVHYQEVISWYLFW